MSAAAPFDVGIHSRIPFEDYAAIDALNISRLKEIKRSPAHYRHRLSNPLVTPPLILGTAAHCAVLEPERFARQFAQWDRRSDSTGNLCPRNGKWWDAFLQANAGKTIITEDEANLARAIGAAVRNDPVAAPYLESGEPEVALTWQIGSRACKGRVDWMTARDARPALVGLKTSRDCRPYQFGAQAAKLGYHLQWAYYGDGFESIKNIAPHLVEIVVESAPPHAVGVYMIPEDVILQGREEYLALYELLEHCERTGSWPGPLTEEQVLTLPSWVYQAGDDITAIGLEA